MTQIGWHHARLEALDARITPIDNHLIQKAAMMDRQNPGRATSSVTAYR